MISESYPFTLPPLPYAYDALEPYITPQTLHYHHDKHFKTYVDKLNDALRPYPALHHLSLKALLANPARVPQPARTAVVRNGGGAYNHRHYFALLRSPRSKNEPSGELRAAIERRFGSFELFKKQFSEQAAAVFGSGWTMLTQTARGGLRIVNLANQETTVPQGETPLVVFDVWEHAYYLQYKNLRAEYISALWSVVNFKEAERRFVFSRP